jgi:hypothetical protein
MERGKGELIRCLQEQRGVSDDGGRQESRSSERVQCAGEEGGSCGELERVAAGRCGVRAIVKLPREGEGWESNHRLCCLRGQESITAQLLLALRPVSSGRCSWRSD